jgi:hypothetical protein
MAIQQMSDEFWKRLDGMANRLNTPAEDIIIVMTGETAGTLDPARTRYQRRPIDKPPGNNWEGAAGYLGLNTMGWMIGKTLGLTPKEWWHIADLSPEQNLDYTEKYWNWALKSIGKDKFESAADLYLANLAWGIWHWAHLHKGFSPKLVIASSKPGGPNPEIYATNDSFDRVFGNNDGILTLDDIALSTVKLASQADPNFMTAKPYLDQYHAWKNKQKALVSGFFMGLNVGWHPLPGGLTETINRMNKPPVTQPAIQSQLFVEHKFSNSDLLVALTAISIPVGIYFLKDN